MVGEASVPGAVQTKRRKSLFRRIADSLSALVPSNIFPSVGLEFSSNGSDTSTLNTRKRFHDGFGAFSEERETQTSSALSTRDTLDVDLDALDNSDCELSAHSSTSGVSSLLPRNCNPKSWNPLRERFDDHSGFKKPGTFSDITNSVTSDSTFKTSSVTPWILSLNTKPQESLGSSRPAKKQRLSSALSSCSSLPDMDKKSVFYQGRTTYGGAAGFRFPSNSRGLLERTVPLRFELEQSTGSCATALNGPNLSSTARRILESIERFSTPLTVADRIPVPRHMDTPQQPTTTPVRTNQKLHRFPPYLESYRRLKYAQRKAMRSSNDTSVQPSSFIEAKTTTISSGASASSSSGTNLFVGLNGVPTTSFSGFGLSSSHPSRTSNGQSFGGASISSNPLSSVATSDPISSASFTFASPIRKSSSLATHLALLSPNELPSAYTFSTPQQPRGSCVSLGSHLQPHSTTRHEPTLSKSVSSPVFDIIMNSSKTSDTPVGAFSNTPDSRRPVHPSSLWRCDTCLLENSEIVDTCTACLMPRIVAAERDTQPPQSPDNTTPSLKPISTAGSKVLESPALNSEDGNLKKMERSVGGEISSSNGKWECPTCMVFNENARPSCICCQTSKPDSDQSVPESRANAPKTSVSYMSSDMSTSTVAPNLPTVTPSGSLFRFGLNGCSTNSSFQPSSVFADSAVFTQNVTSSTAVVPPSLPPTIPSSGLFRFGLNSGAVNSPFQASASAPQSAGTFSQIVSSSSTVVPPNLIPALPTSGLFRFGLSSGTVNSPSQPCASALQPAATFNQSSTLSFDGANNSNKWECPTCMVFNDSDKPSCVCCQTTKPAGNRFDSTPDIGVPKSLSASLFQNSPNTFVPSLPSLTPSNALFTFGFANAPGNSSFQSNSDALKPSVFTPGVPSRSDNVFSATSDTVPRKKAHAVRRFQR